MRYFTKRKIISSFHYIPLHESKKTRKYYRFNGNDRYTTKESERLLRMPMHYNLTLKNVDYITGVIRDYYGWNCHTCITSFSRESWYRK